MELDKRIKDITDIKSVINSNKEFVGKKGYFAENIGKFKDLSTCQYGQVHDYREDDKCFCDFHFYTNRANESTWYPYFIPEESLKPIEKKYRPYENIQEFFDDTGRDIGDVIQYRGKISNTLYRCSIVCAMIESNGTEMVCIGNAWYTLGELFNDYEVLTPGGYMPFGVLDDE